MDPTTPPARGEILKHLQGLLKAGAGSVVVASITLAASNAEARTSDPAPPPTIAERVAEIRTQLAVPDRPSDPSEPGLLLAWGNGWHNWHNGWHNWHNWRNF